jgi:hypothetical protein
LCCPTNTFVHTSFISIIPAIGVSEKESIDVPPLQNFGKVDPILQIPFVSGAILRILESIVSLTKLGDFVG